MVQVEQEPERHKKKAHRAAPIMARSVAETNAMVTAGQEPALWPVVVETVKVNGWGRLSVISKDRQDLKVLLGSLPFLAAGLCVCTCVKEGRTGGEKAEAWKGRAVASAGHPGRDCKLLQAGEYPSYGSYSWSFPILFDPPRADLSPF